jgi:hypothetical protein
MGLQDLLRQHRDAILEAWINSVIDTYPVEASRFFKAQSDQFANPVGNSVRNGLAGIFDQLFQGLDREAVIPILDPIIRIRAIQDFSPSQAVGFVFTLKQIIRKKIQKQLADSRLNEEFTALERSVDDLALLAFDIFDGCRERLYDIKANQEKTKVYKAFRRAGLVTEITDDDPGLHDSN